MAAAEILEIKRGIAVIQESPSPEWLLLKS